jgi:hypothetical protein
MRGRPGGADCCWASRFDGAASARRHACPGRSLAGPSAVRRGASVIRRARRALRRTRLIPRAGVRPRDFPGTFAGGSTPHGADSVPHWYEADIELTIARTSVRRVLRVGNPTSSGATSGYRRKVRQRTRSEQAAAQRGDQTRPPVRAIHACAVGGDTRVRVHLPVQLRNQHEREPRTQGRRAPGSRPDAGQAVEVVPHGLRPRTDLLGRHHRVSRVHLGTVRLWDQPVARDGDARNSRGLTTEALLSRGEIHGPWKRGQHHELREGQPGAVCDVRRGLERGGAIAREPEDE